MPLFGKRILITRPEAQSKTLAGELEEIGAQIISMPVIEIVEPDSWQELDQAIENITDYDWLIFASSNAVNSFANRLRAGCGEKRVDAIDLYGRLEPTDDNRNCRGEERVGVRSGSDEPMFCAPALSTDECNPPLQVPTESSVSQTSGTTRRGQRADCRGGLRPARLPYDLDSNSTERKKFPKIAVIGKMTAHAASEHGLPVDYYPDKYLAEDFIAQFPDYPNLASTKMLWPRTNIGRNFILDKLEAAGATINVVPAYKTVLPDNAQELSKRLNQLLLNKQLDIITLTSKQIAINLSQIISLSLGCAEESFQTGSSSSKEQAERLREILSEVLIVTIGPQTSEGALNYLGKMDLEASPHTNKGMVAALTMHYRG